MNKYYYISVKNALKIDYSMDVILETLWIN